MVHTPLHASVGYSMLASHPNKELVQFMICAICEGCRIGFNRSHPLLKSARSNLKAAWDHRSQITSQQRYPYIELQAPFPQEQSHKSISAISEWFPNGKWKLIIHLSNARGHSVNDGMAKFLCSFKYVTIDETIKGVIHLGPGTLLTKIDIKSVFRLLPVLPEDKTRIRDAMEWWCMHWHLSTLWAMFNPQAVQYFGWLVHLDCQTKQCVIPYTLSGWLSDNGPLHLSVQPRHDHSSLGLFGHPTGLGKSKRPIYQPGYHPGYHQHASKNTRGEASEVIAGSWRVDWLHISQKANILYLADSL